MATKWVVWGNMTLADLGFTLEPGMEAQELQQAPGAAKENMCQNFCPLS